MSSQGRSLQARVQIGFLTCVGKDIGAPEQKQHHNAVVPARPCVCTVANDIIDMEMTVEPPVKIVP
jgi:hypothetical protein